MVENGQMLSDGSEGWICPSHAHIRHLTVSIESILETDSSQKNGKKWRKSLACIFNRQTVRAHIWEGKLGYLIRGVSEEERSTTMLHAPLPILTHVNGHSQYPPNQSMHSNIFFKNSADTHIHVHTCVYVWVCYVYVPF